MFHALFALAPLRPSRRSGNRATVFSVPKRCVPMLENVMLETILLIVLVLLLVGALPSWGYSTNWGYGPSGLLGVVLVVFVVLLVAGRV